MAVPVRIEVTGLRDVRKTLRDAGDDFTDLKDLNRDVGQLVADRADDLVPRRSGKLAGTGRASRAKTKATVKYGKARVPYAGPIHFGWPARNISPQPFLYDALDDRRDEVIRLFEDRIAEVTRKASDGPEFTPLRGGAR